MTTLIKNGTIITAADSYKADILVKNGIVSEIGREISKIASEIIDAGEKWILPGGVDVHTHLDSSRDGMTTVDDFETATAAAAAGGTTTVVDYADQAPGTTLAATLEQWKAKSAPRAVVDYGFHLALSEVDEGTLGELAALVEAGVTSFEVSLDRAGGARIGDDALLELLQRAGAAGALPVIHPGNGEVSALLRRRLAAEGKLAPRFIPSSAPPELEGEAAGRVLALAEMARAPVYLADLSSAHAVERVKAARDRGQAAYAETFPQYLVLSSDRYEDPDAMKFHASPPLRPAWHQEVLWRAVVSGDVHAIASGHTALNYAGQKDLGRENFTLGPRGMPGIQERLSLVHSSGVQAGRISPNRFVELVSTLPAKLFGLFPRKGTLAVGSDADMVIFDPRAELTLSKAVALSRVDYTPFEGIRARGAAWMVIQRGRVIAREGRVMGRPGAGEFLARSRFAGV